MAAKHKRRPGRPSISEGEESVLIGVRVSQETAAALEERAEEEGRTLSALVREILERSVRRWEASRRG